MEHVTYSNDWVEVSYLVLATVNVHFWKLQLALCFTFEDLPIFVVFFLLLTNALMQVCHDDDNFL